MGGTSTSTTSRHSQGKAASRTKQSWKETCSGPRQWPATMSGHSECARDGFRLSLVRPLWTSLYAHIYESVSV